MSEADQTYKQAEQTTKQQVKDEDNKRRNEQRGQTTPPIPKKREVELRRRSYQQYLSKPSIFRDKASTARSLS